MDSEQWTVGSVKCTVSNNSRQWTVDFYVWFGNIRLHYKIFALFRFEYSLEAKIRFRSKFVSHVKFADSSDAKQANKTILFASKQINIRFIFAYIRFVPNMSGAP